MVGVCRHFLESWMPADFAYLSICECLYPTDTSHYENVPEGWCLTTLGEVFFLQAGKNISANDIHEFSPSFPYACYGGNGIRGYVSAYNKDGQFPIIGRQGALCGNVNFAEGKFYATEHAVVVTCFAGVNVNWARLVLEAMNLNQYATATAQPGLSVATVNEVDVLLPPLEEQNRIADFVLKYLEIIEHLESGTNDLMRSLEKAKSKILDLAIHGKLVPQDANDEPASELLKRINPKAIISCDSPHYGSLPQSWSWTNLGLLFDIESAKRVTKDQWKARGVPFYRTREIVQLSLNGYVDNDLFIDEEHYSSLKNKYGIPMPNDIMLTAVGTIGKTYVVSENDRFYYKDASVLCLKNSHNINPQYITLAFSSSLVQNQLFEKSKGTTVDTITIEKANNYIVPIPPIEEQSRIVSKVKELFSLLDMVKESLQA